MMKVDKSLFETFPLLSQFAMRINTIFLFVIPALGVWNSFLMRRFDGDNFYSLIDNIPNQDNLHDIVSLMVNNIKKTAALNVLQKGGIESKIDESRLRRSYMDQTSWKHPLEYPGIYSGTKQNIPRRRYIRLVLVKS